MTILITPGGLHYPDDNEAVKLTAQRIRQLALDLDPSPAANTNRIANGWVTVAAAGAAVGTTGAFATGWASLGVAPVKWRVINGELFLTGVAFFNGGLPSTNGTFMTLPASVAPTVSDVSAPIGGCSFQSVATTRGTPTTATLCLVNVRATGAVVWQTAAAPWVGAGTPECIQVQNIKWRLNGF